VYRVVLAFLFVLSVVGCGTVTVTSNPQSAMVFDTRMWPPATPVSKDVHLAGFTPCEYGKYYKIHAVKARWPDGSQSQWQVLPQDKIGLRHDRVHFEKSDAHVPETGTTNWFPVVGPKGYVEFYCTTRTDISIYQQYGTELCLVGDVSIPQFGHSFGPDPKKNCINALEADDSGRLRIPCSPGKNVFAARLGSARVQISIDVRENKVTPVRLDYKEIPHDSRNRPLTVVINPGIDDQDALNGNTLFTLKPVLEDERNVEVGVRMPSK
jgi:hypothetical protein